MTRIRPTSASSEASSEPPVADGDRAERIAHTLAGVWGHRAEAHRAYTAATDALRASGTLPPRLVELLRLRIAFHNQCRTCMASRRTPDLVGEDLVCSLERPYEAPDLTDAERAALRFADLFASDHLSIDDAVYDSLRVHFAEGELVELGMTCAYFVGFGRLAATWDIVEDLPSDFADRGGEPITPWGHQEVVALTPRP